MMIFWKRFCEKMGYRRYLLRWFYQQSRNGNLVMIPGNDKNIWLKLIAFSVACHKMLSVLSDKQNIAAELYPSEAECLNFHGSFDERSQKTIETSPFFQYRQLIKPGKLYVFIGENNIPPLSKQHSDDLLRAQRQYKLPPGYDYYEEVFVYHHGLKNAPPEVLNYIKGKIFIDAGAYIGDSALVLAGYSPSKIFSFDISERNGTCLKRTMAENGLPSSKVEFVRAALADKCGKMAFFDSGYAGTSLAASGQNECDVTTLDAFTKTRTEKIGFIKADLEGMAYEMTLGMLETLKRDRPVLSLAIYHSIDEFYGIRKLLGEQLENYTYRVVGLNHAPAKEIVLFAWPNEVMPSKNWWWD